MAQGRPRGFIESWNPTTDTRKLIGSVQLVLEDMSDIKPFWTMSVRYVQNSQHR